MLNFVFQNLKLNGCMLDYTLRFPFDIFEKTTTRTEWRAVVGSLRQLHETRMAVICIHSSILSLVRDCAKQVAKFDR